MSAPNATSFNSTLSQAHFALLSGRAATAEQALRALSAQHPQDPNIQWLLGAALLAQDRIEASAQVLEPLVEKAPDFASARVDLARAYRANGQPQRARPQLQRVLKADPHHHLAWLAYADVLVDLGQHADAITAYDRARLTDPQRRLIEAATAALVADDRKSAEGTFRQILQTNPSHAGALCGLAAVSLAADKPHDAERLLRHALRQSAHLPLAQRGLGQVLVALGRLEEAEACARSLLRIEPENPQTWITLGGVATRLMRQEQALEAYEQAALITPREVRLRLSIGHVHKTLGHRQDSEAAYKTALAMHPGLGEAYWSLADLKNYMFSDAEVAAMQALLGGDRDRADEAQLNFALGRAFEQRGEYNRAFGFYVHGNELRRADQPFDIDGFEARTVRICQFFDRAYFAAHSGGGDPDPSPIFIVGLPRSGSTLIEQILSSHSRVEGTMELPNIIHMVHEFEDTYSDRDGYPEALASAHPATLRALGARYIEETAPLRHGREHFTDKLPNNFNHIGLIQSILPNATIIDARRHPMDSCFSTFKQYFAEGQTFSYDLIELGRYYRSYIELMDHWDAVLPGKVLHVQYEELVRDPEATIRRLLTHAGLPFEPACINFHQTKRSVRTASAEQVRQPLYTSGVGYWRNFERELEPLRIALGDALERFPAP
jgi:tetratricopeptide (TPR) repeat protein